MSDDEDVKNLLSKAFGQEPPLGIDRDEVLAQGRKRLRRKRFFEAGSVVALVVVAAVGAATLTRLADTPDTKLPPAASSTQQAPPGPDLPVTSPPFPPSAHTTTNTRLPTSVTVTQQQLTAMLYAVGVFTEKEAQPLPGHSDLPGFQKMGEAYFYEADVQRGSTRGYVQIMVDPGRGGTVTCDTVPRPYGGCQIRTDKNTSVTVSNYQYSTGQRSVRAEGVSPTGARVVASADNLTARERDAHLPPPDAPPVLSENELVILVTKAGFGD